MAFLLYFANRMLLGFTEGIASIRNQRLPLRGQPLPAAVSRVVGRLVPRKFVPAPLLVFTKIFRRYGRKRKEGREKVNARP